MLYPLLFKLLQCKFSKCVIAVLNIYIYMYMCVCVYTSHIKRKPALERIRTREHMAPIAWQLQTAHLSPRPRGLIYI
jgi:hypothetical protein